MTEDKPFCISKWKVLEAWKRVRANRGGAGIDDVSIAEFETRLKPNLYRIWNRMSSGSYVPPPVRRIMIPKADGKERPLGIPTVGDRDYGRYYPSALYRTFDCINRRLVRWAMKKYKRFRGHQRAATQWLRRIARERPELFAHWKIGAVP